MWARMLVTQGWAIDIRSLFVTSTWSDVSLRPWCWFCTVASVACRSYTWHTHSHRSTMLIPRHYVPLDDALGNKVNTYRHTRGSRTSLDTSPYSTVHRSVTQIAFFAYMGLALKHLRSQSHPRAMICRHLIMDRTWIDGNIQLNLNLHTPLYTYFRFTYYFF